MSWSDGYVTEVGYTHAYYRELSPLMMELALTYRKQAVRRARPLRYLELGFGQGLSLNIHAAAMNGEFWGNDFNPAHAAHAAELARISKNGARISAESFAQLAARPDLPEFDVIALHGVWSWVSDANRAVIVDIVRRKLVPGGLLYMGYNATPGWSAIIPVRNLMLQHADLAAKASTTPLPARIDGAIAFAEKLAAAGAPFFNAQNGAREWLTTLTEANRSYLAHEYFNADWHPMAFADVARQLEEAKVSFAAWGSLKDHYDAINLTADQQALLAGIPDPTLRESTRDFCVNRQFRRDIWVKDPRPVDAARQTELLSGTRVVLTSCVAAIPLKIEGRGLVVKLPPAVYQDVLATLASDNYAPKTIGDLAAKHPGLGLPRLAEAVILFTGAGHMSPAQDEAETRMAKPKTDALNAHLLREAAEGLDTTATVVLASPVTGGGISLSGFEHLFLQALKQGATAPDEWAAAAWKVLAAQGRSLMKNGQALATVEENLDAVKLQARRFAETRLPLLRALMVT